MKLPFITHFYHCFTIQTLRISVEVHCMGSPYLQNQNLVSIFQLYTFYSRKLHIITRYPLHMWVMTISFESELNCFVEAYKTLFKVKDNLERLAHSYFAHFNKFYSVIIQSDVMLSLTKIAVVWFPVCNKSKQILYCMVHD